MRALLGVREIRICTRVLGRLSFLVTITDTVGTCSMLPREKGGVVDHSLKVSVSGMQHNFSEH